MKARMVDLIAVVGMGIWGCATQGTESPNSPGTAEYSCSTDTLSEGVVGERTADEVMAVLIQNLAELRYTYNDHLSRDPTLSGTLITRFAVEGSGVVICCAVVQSDFNDSLFEAEIVSKIEGWAFPPLSVVDTTRAVYPFEFMQ